MPSGLGRRCPNCCTFKNSSLPRRTSLLTGAISCTYDVIMIVMVIIVFSARFVRRQPSAEQHTLPPPKHNTTPVAHLTHYTRFTQTCFSFCPHPMLPYPPPPLPPHLSPPPPPPPPPASAAAVAAAPPTYFRACVRACVCGVGCFFRGLVACVDHVGTTPASFK